MDIKGKNDQWEEDRNCGTYLVTLGAHCVEWA